MLNFSISLVLPPSPARQAQLLPFNVISNTLCHFGITIPCLSPTWVFQLPALSLHPLALTSQHETSYGVPANTPCNAEPNHRLESLSITAWNFGSHEKVVIADKACRTFKGTAKRGEGGSVLPSTPDPMVTGLTVLSISSDSHTLLLNSGMRQSSEAILENTSSQGIGVAFKLPQLQQAKLENSRYSGNYQPCYHTLLSKPFLQQASSYSPRLPIIWHRRRSRAPQGILVRQTRRESFQTVWLLLGQPLSRFSPPQCTGLSSNHLLTTPCCARTWEDRIFLYFLNRYIPLPISTTRCGLRRWSQDWQV